MASWLDDLDSLMASIGKHPGAETLMSAIPAAAGAFLLARPYQTSIGTPIGAILAGLGGLGAYQGIQGLNQQREDERTKAGTAGFNKVLGRYAPAIGPPAPLPPMPQLAEQFATTGGMNTSDSLAAAGALEKQPTVARAETPVEFFNRDPKGFAAMKSAERSGAGGTKLSEEQQSIASNAGLDPSKADSWTPPERARYLKALDAHTLKMRPPPQPFMAVMPTDPTNPNAPPAIVRASKGGGSATITPLAGVTKTTPKAVTPPLTPQQRVLKLGAFRTEYNKQGTPWFGQKQDFGTWIKANHPEALAGLGIESIGTHKSTGETVYLIDGKWWKP